MGIVPYIFEGREVRVTDRHGSPWFVLADVCRVLGIGNTSDAARRLKPQHKATLDTLDSIEGIAGGPQVRAITVISEPGLYKLVATSRKPEAERFMDWVYEEVLPSIRRTGSYHAQPGPDAALAKAAITAKQDRAKALVLNAATRAFEAMMKQLPAGLGATSVQELAARCFNAGVPGMLPLPKIAEPMISTTDLADEIGMSPITLGRMVGALKTPENGENRLTKARSNDKQVAQWYWNQRGASAVRDAVGRAVLDNRPTRAA